MGQCQWREADAADSEQRVVPTALGGCVCLGSGGAAAQDWQPAWREQRRHRELQQQVKRREDNTVSRMSLRQPRGWCQSQSRGEVLKKNAIASFSALTHTRHLTRRVPGVPGSAKRRFVFSRGRDLSTRSRAPRQRCAPSSSGTRLRAHLRLNQQSESVFLESSSPFAQYSYPAGPFHRVPI